jgi:hypothetical protein
VEFRGWRDLAFANLIFAHYDLRSAWPQSITELTNRDVNQLATRYGIPRDHRGRFALLVEFVVRYYLLRRITLDHDTATVKTAVQTVNSVD